LLFFGLLIWAPAGNQTIVIAMAVWMLIWWISETVSLSVTALIPLIVLPLTGVMSQQEVGNFYASPMVFLFFGGFLLALGIERWSLHKRISLWILLKTGGTPDRVLAGFLLATGLLSMWISNTATAVMMFPLAISVSRQLNATSQQDLGMERRLLLAVAYGANIGGIGTLIGTPPNLILAGYLQQTGLAEITFLSWMAIGGPIALLLLILAWLVLRWGLPTGKSEDGNAVHAIFQKEWTALEKPEAGAYRFAWTLGLVVLAWLLRSSLAEWLHWDALSDTSIALIGGFSLFLIPSGKPGEALLSWQETRNLPWGILLLFGGGLALAGAISQTGIIDYIGQWLATETPESTWALILIAAGIGIFATELISNMALVTVLLPLIYFISNLTGVSFLTLAIPLTIGSSCAFMFPMATPPNAIVFASGRLKIKDMATAGILMNILALLLIWGVAVCFF
jgi:sodium-dependent dicarboxylate transporter 2/3/5